MLDRAALAGISLRSVGWLRQHASWRRLALRARRRWRGRCAPGACGDPDLRLALRARGARRTALRAEGAARLCAGRRSRWLPSPPRATRSAPMTWALRAWAPAAARSPPRATRSAPKAWALRARAPTYMLSPPPITCARCLLVVGMSKTSCASRCSKRSVQGALRAPAEGEGLGRGRGVVQTSSSLHLGSCASGACGGTLVCCRSMCSASRRGAPLGSERILPRRQADPPRFQRACCSASRSSRADASALRAGGRPRKGVRRIIDPKGLGSQRARSSAGYDPRIHMYMSLRAEKSSCIPGIRGYLA